MKYLRISVLTVLVLSTAGCDDVSDRIVYFFSSGGSVKIISWLLPPAGIIG